MDGNLEYYKALQRELEELRKANPLIDGNEDTPEEEALLDRMDDVWYTLSDEEKAQLNGN